MCISVCRLCVIFGIVQNQDHTTEATARSTHNFALEVFSGMLRFFFSSLLLFIWNYIVVFVAVVFVSLFFSYSHYHFFPLTATTA